MTTVAIMQPTYLPWTGYFALMDRVDVFVFLDCVQFDRASWQQRNRIKGANGAQMLTAPVFKKGLRDQLISEARINPAAGFPESHIRALENSYARAPFRDAYLLGLTEILRRGHEKLIDLTMELIDWLAKQLGITTPCVLGNSLGAEGSKATLIADICVKLGADRYVSPPGAQDYIDQSNAFGTAGIEVILHDYEPPAYTQLNGPFVSHLSVIDLMFNVGMDSLSIIRKGVR